MAAFPPPDLSLHIPEPLRGVLRACEVNCVAGCCGVDAFDISATHIVTDRAEQLTAAAWVEALSQMERLLDTVYRHRGSVSADELDGLFNHVWQTPYDCLLYFADWRREVAAAVRQLPSFFDPSWLSDDVTALRDAIAAERAFDRLPVLADALEEAGCDHPLILTHLREPADHAHHCWVLDLLAVNQ